MPSTFTSALGLEKQATGENDSTWGTLLNAVLDDLDDAIADELSKSVAGASDVTLTAAEALHMTHFYTGALTGNIGVIVPASEKLYFVHNNTSGSFTLTVKTSAGSGVLVPQGGKSILYCDGTDVLNWLVHLLGTELFLDADLDTSITVDTDDRVDFKVQGQDLFRLDGTAASAVNGVDFVAAATGNPFRVLAQGSDTNIGIDIVSKGAKNIDFYSDALELFRIAYVASAVNFPQVEPSATGNNVKFAAFGDDTDVGISYQPKGAGIHDFLTGPINENKGSDIASATTTDIGAATGNFVDITGTTTITGFGTVKAGTRRILQFDGVLTLTHNASSLILPGGANITTAAGDVAVMVSLGGGNWICTHYMRADGVSAVSGEKIVQTKLDTSQATTSGTEFDFTSPFSTTLKAEVLFQGVSLSGTDSLLVQIGDAGGIETTGYVSTGGDSAGETSATDGFVIPSGTDTHITSGIYNLINLTGNSWVGSFAVKNATNNSRSGGGDKNLSGTLTTVRVTRTGTDTFDAGAVSVLWFGY